jgi:hypothetical protein
LDPALKNYSVEKPTMSAGSSHHRVKTPDDGWIQQSSRLCDPMDAGSSHHLMKKSR